jgi:predicted acylesterase/phospholipase RssA
VGSAGEARGAFLRRQVSSLLGQHDLVLLDVTPEHSGWELPVLLAQAQEVWWLVEAGADEPALQRLQALLRRAPELAGRTRLVWVRREGDPLPPAGRHGLGIAPDFQVTLGEKGGQPGRLQKRDLARLVHHLGRRRLGLALGGGGMRGLAHLGVLRALDRAGIYPDLISGTSIGAIMAAAYSWGHSPDAILGIFQKEVASRGLLRRAPWAGILKTWSLFRFGGWECKLRRYLGDAALEQLPTPVYPVSVDLILGACVVRDEGDVVAALLESSNLPVLIRPILRDGAALVDGGVLNNVPGDVARDRGADLVVGVDVGAPLAPRLRGNGFLKVLLRVLAVRQSNLLVGPGAVDLMITPDLGAHGVFHYGQFAELVRAGEVAAEEAVPALKGLLAVTGSAE